MAIQSYDVVAGDDILATDHNYLRADLLTNAIAISGVKTFNDDIYLAATKKLYFDGGSDTFLQEDSANNLAVFVAGNKKVDFKTDGLAVVSGQKLYIDGGLDTYLYESVANSIYCVCGGATSVIFDTNGVNSQFDYLMIPGRKYYLDSGSNTYITESASDVISFVAGGNNVVKITSSVLEIQRNYSLNLIGTSGIQTILAASNQLQFFEGLNFNMYLQNGGSLYVDYEYYTFSPDIRKHQLYKDKAELTAKDFLDWALEDAKKPVKPYTGLPMKKTEKHLVTDENNIFDTDEEVEEEHKKYAKDISKIAIGIAKWAEQAELRLQTLEAKR